MGKRRGKKKINQPLNESPYSISEMKISGMDMVEREDESAKELQQKRGHPIMAPRCVAMFLARISRKNP